MSDETMVLLDQLIALAAKDFDGHFTIMKFTTNWRVSMDTPGTPRNGFGIEQMSIGKTFEEAARNALVRGRWKQRRYKDGQET